MQVYGKTEPLSNLSIILSLGKSFFFFDDKIWEIKKNKYKKV